MLSQKEDESPDLIGSCEWDVSHKANPYIRRRISRDNVLHSVRRYPPPSMMRLLFLEEDEELSSREGFPINPAPTWLPVTVGARFVHSTALESLVGIEQQGSRKQSVSIGAGVCFCPVCSQLLSVSSAEHAERSSVATQRSSIANRVFIREENCRREYLYVCIYK